MARVKNASAKQVAAFLRQQKRNKRNAKTGMMLPRKSQSVRNSLQCKSDTLKKLRCKKRTAHTNRCWIHLAKEKNLRIKPSGIQNAGKGLYTWKKPMAKNQQIDTYTGVRTNHKGLDAKYGRNSVAEYAICNGPNRCIDAYLTTYGAPRFVNDSRGSKFKNNSKIVANRKFKLRATRNLKPHEEIFASYGNSYWPRKHLRKK